MEPKTARRLDTTQVTPDIGTARAECSADSIILTLAGERAAHALKPGDKVITRDSGTATVRSVQTSRQVVDAVLIKAGSLGHRRPPEDTIIPASARVLLRDWRAQALYGRVQAIADARRLCDGEFIALMPDHPMDIVTLEFDAPHILYVGGLEIACGPDQDVQPL